MFGFFVTVYAGLEHAFEADHLLAVNNLVTNRNKIAHAVKDGIYWGIGHTATIFFIGVLMIFLKMNIDEQIFSYFEAVVGLVLVGLGVFRLSKLNTARKNKLEIIEEKPHSHHHKAAFGIGMIHGLAGSGALVVLVLSQMRSVSEGLLYILIFGLGSVLGMFLASGLFSVPFSKKIMNSVMIQIALILVSSLLCIGYGGFVFYHNLFG